jgi:hypothetical protein
MAKNKLDLETIKNLYEFGALLVYEVRLFDKLMFKVDVVMRTFDRQAAQKYADHLIENKQLVEIFEYWVKFDDAYKIKK